MDCLYCGEQLSLLNSQEAENGYHEECFKQSSNPKNMILSNEGTEEFILENVEDFLDEESNKIDKQEFDLKINSIPVTTTSSFIKYEVAEEIDVVSAECVFGMNIFRDLFADIRDLVGGRSKASQKVLKDLKQTCMYEIKLEASKLGADGIVGLKLDYQEFSGGSRGMLFLVASGTAVKFK